MEFPISHVKPYQPIDKQDWYRIETNKRPLILSVKDCRPESWAIRSEK